MSSRSFEQLRHLSLSPEAFDPWFADGRFTWATAGGDAILAMFGAPDDAAHGAGAQTPTLLFVRLGAADPHRNGAIATGVAGCFAVVKQQMLMLRRSHDTVQTRSKLGKMQKKYENKVLWWKNNQEGEINGNGTKQLWWLDDENFTHAFRQFQDLEFWLFHLTTPIAHSSSLLPFLTHWVWEVYPKCTESFNLLQVNQKCSLTDESSYIITTQKRRLKSRTVCFDSLGNFLTPLWCQVHNFPHKWAITLVFKKSS